MKLEKVSILPYNKIILAKSKKLKNPKASVSAVKITLEPTAGS